LKVPHKIPPWLRLFGAKATVAVLQIGMRRVTTTSPVLNLRIDKPGPSNCKIRINANGFQPWEQQLRVSQLGKTRMHPPSLELQAVSADARVNAGRAAVDLEPAGALVSEGLKRSIQCNKIISTRRGNWHEVFGASAKVLNMALGGVLCWINSRRPEYRRNS
jgi:hypothetical protein